MREKNLATVQVVEKLSPIEGADFIEVAAILGWSVIVRKGEFKEGDKCIYHEIDTLLPDVERYAFIEGKKKRLKTKKLKGVISQGLALPLSSVDSSVDNLQSMKVGDDLTELLGVMKYSPTEKNTTNFPGTPKRERTFPSYIPKTDENNVQSCWMLAREMVGKECYITVKVDGMSGTYAHNNGRCMVCSRHHLLEEDNGDSWWKMEKKYSIGDKLSEIGNVAIQGEIAGPGIQGNKMGLEQVTLFVFDVLDLNKGVYFGLADIIAMAARLEIPTVPIIEEAFIIPSDISVKTLLEMSEGLYDGTKNEREGIVVRTVNNSYSSRYQHRHSFKVRSNRFLLKNKL